MKQYKITYKRKDLNDGVHYSITYKSEMAESPEQALLEIKQNQQNKYYVAMVNAEDINIEALQ